MLKKLSIIAMALSLGSGSLFALIHPRFEQCECWGVQAEYLYWLPSVGATDYVTPSTSDTVFVIGTIESNSLGFHSGFRVEGAYSLECGSEIHGRYAWLYASNSDTITGTHLYAVQSVGGQIATGFFAGSATSDLSLHYQNAELLFSRRIWDSCSCSEFYLFGGLDFYYGKYTENYTYVNTGALTNVVQSTAHNYGIGPEFGLEFAIPLNNWLSWCGCEGFNLSVVGQASGALLAQQEHNTYYNNDSTAPSPFQDVSSNKNWRVIQAWNARAGLCYAGDVCSMDYKLEVGYEFTSYINALKKYELKTGGGGFFDLAYYDLAFQGLYVALGFAF